MKSGNLPKGIGDLVISHLVSELLEHIDKVFSVLAAVQGKVYLMEDEAVVVIEVIVTSLVNHSHLNVCQSNASSHHSKRGRSCREGLEKMISISITIHFLLIIKMIYLIQ